MGRVCWLDVQVAAAGDMLLGALLDAGADEARVRAGLETLGVTGWSLTTSEVVRGAFRAKRAEVRVDGEEEAGGPDSSLQAFKPSSLQAFEPQRLQVHRSPMAHDHDHGHGLSHSHSHGAGEAAGPHESEAGPDAGSWRWIRETIAAAPLPERARARALAAYGRLAEAEARLHGMPVDDVVLHEVGAVDAIVDVVGVCLALEDLGVDRIVATPLPMGTGRVQAAHGSLPLPAPATLEVCKGWPVVASPWPGEWVTPTGAALVTALAEPGGMPAMTPRAIGWGAGRKDPPQVANLVRVVIGDDSAPAGPPGASGSTGDAVVELACNLDDATGQLVADAVARLLSDGALDAWVAPVQMKKGRPGVVLHALAKPGDADRLAEALLRHTPTLGVRRTSWTRDVLERWFDTVTTPFGDVRIKVGGRGGVAWHAMPEWEDVAERARTAGVSASEVHAAAVAAWHARRG